MHIVTCPYCKLKFDRDRISFHQISERRYAHVDCWVRESARAQKEEKDRMDLDKFICELFGLDTVSIKIRKQIKTYREEYNYTYEGILKALNYFYIVKKGDISKANEGIGIVPYCHEQARQYYYALWLAKEKNQNKNIEDYKPKKVEVVIPPPQRNLEKLQLFTFLDEEEAD